MHKRNAFNHHENEHINEPAITLKVTVVVVFICSCFVYSNTLNAEFVYDDSRAILSNRDLRPETPWLNILRNDFWGTPLRHSGSHKSYRPLCVLSFRLNYYIGELNSFGYHVINVLLHAVTSCLFSYFCYNFFGKEYLAFVGGLMFSLHPIHTEAVAGIVGRADVAAAMFFLLSLILYQSATQPSVKFANIKMILCILSAFLSMFTKELGATVLIVCAVYDVVIVSNVNLCSPKKAVQQLLSNGGLYRCILLISSTIFMLYIRFLIMGYSPPSFSPADNPTANDPIFMTRLLTFLYLPLRNLVLLLYPWELSYDWSQFAIPLVKSIFTIEAISSFMFYFILFVIALTYLNYSNKIHQIYGECYVNKKEKRKLSHDGLSTNNFLYVSWNITIFSIVFMVLTFLPATNLFFYVGFMIAERVLYIPSIGFVILIINSINVLTTVFPKKQKNANIIILIVLILFGVRTYKRNFVWKNEESLYRSGIDKSPAKSYGNLANVLMQQKKLEDAEVAYKFALKYRSNMADTHYNLGILFQNQGRYNEAIASYKNAIKYRPRLASAHLNLGLTLSTLGKNEEALKVFLSAYNISDAGLKNPHVHNTALTHLRYNTGKVLYEMGRYKEAVKIFLDAIKRMPDGYEPQSIYNLIGMCYEGLDEISNAEAWYLKAIHSKSNHIPALLSRGQLLMKSDEKETFSEGEDIIKKAISLEPNRTESYLVYGQQLEKVGRHVEAIYVVKEIFTIEKNHAQALTFLATTYRDMKDYGNALYYQEKAAEVNSKDGRVLSNLGALYHILKRYNDAMIAYQKALALHPDNEVLKENIKKLRLAMKTKK